ncbi:D-aminoacyl-tRNA deacylase [Picrophilus oshimae DSM 9789]|nr:D-aminoacyl-tRNA deacylase [Picrophilus oshimae DSM 9789]
MILRTMDLIIASRMDEASMLMAEKIIDLYDFNRLNENEYQKDGFKLMFIDDLHIYHNMEKLDFDTLIFLSRHSSSAGVKSLTVHSIGNYRKAELGGYDNKTVLSAPYEMSSSLRSIKELYNDDGYNITFEATHHGPYTKNRSYFIEIGTSGEDWHNDKILEIMARSVIEKNVKRFRSGIGIGGGHYAPKISDYFFNNDINIGHIIPKYVSETIKDNQIIESIENTENCSFILIDWKGSPSRLRSLALDAADKCSLELIKI